MARRDAGSFAAAEVSSVPLGGPLNRHGLANETAVQDCGQHRKALIDAPCRGIFTHWHPRQWFFAWSHWLRLSAANWLRFSPALKAISTLFPVRVILGEHW